MADPRFDNALAQILEIPSTLDRLSDWSESDSVAGRSRQPSSRTSSCASTVTASASTSAASSAAASTVSSPASTVICPPSTKGETPRITKTEPDLFRHASTQDLDSGVGDCHTPSRGGVKRWRSCLSSSSSASDSDTDTATDNDNDDDDVNAWDFSCPLGCGWNWVPSKRARVASVHVGQDFPGDWRAAIDERVECEEDCWTLGGRVADQVGNDEESDSGDGSDCVSCGSVRSFDDDDEDEEEIEIC